MGARAGPHRGAGEKVADCFTPKTPGICKKSRSRKKAPLNLREKKRTEKEVMANGDSTGC